MWKFYQYVSTVVSTTPQKLISKYQNGSIFMLITNLLRVIKLIDIHSHDNTEHRPQIRPINCLQSCLNRLGGKSHSLKTSSSLAKQIMTYEGNTNWHKYRLCCCTLLNFTFSKLTWSLRKWIWKVLYFITELLRARVAYPYDDVRGVKVEVGVIRYIVNTDIFLLTDHLSNATEKNHLDCSWLSIFLQKLAQTRHFTKWLKNKTW